WPRRPPRLALSGGTSCSRALLRAGRHALLDARHRCGTVDDASGLHVLPTAFNLLPPAEPHLVMLLQQTKGLTHDLAGVVVEAALDLLADESLQLRRQ